MQYQVAEIATRDKKQAIVFDNETEILLDKKLKAIVADQLVGTRLQSVEDKGLYELLFFVQGTGDEQVQMTLDIEKGKYQIFDPRLEEAIDPHAEVDPNAGLPPDPSADRISEGPTEEEQSGEEEEAGNAEQSSSPGE
jgi:hypothetical protein